jgi:hypothetical protein
MIDIVQLRVRQRFDSNARNALINGMKVRVIHVRDFFCTKYFAKHHMPQRKQFATQSMSDLTGIAFLSQIIQKGSQP